MIAIAAMLFSAGVQSNASSLVQLLDSYRQADGSVVVYVGLKVDEIIDIDQMAENFSIVGSLQMQWQQNELAFIPKEGEETIRTFDWDEFIEYANNLQVRIPRFIFFNQQGKRFSQYQLVVLTASGQVYYGERFTVTLQAPYLNFSKFPFDTQKFKIDFDLLSPHSVFHFEKLQNFSGLGDLLGLEEWEVTSFETSISESREVLGYLSTRFGFQIDTTRKTQYYTLRILTPISLIILISWVTFYLRDYVKRIDVAGGNLLIFIAFNFTISRDLPRLSYLTFMDTILFVAFFITSLTIIVNVMLRYMEVVGRLSLARRIDQYLIWAYPLLYLFGFAFSYWHFI